MAAPAQETARLICSSALDPSADGTLPTQFRIFKAGLNQTSEGDIVFDATAAASVMARYQKHGVDLIIDLNHDSIDETAGAMRADARDARGWFNLEVRPGPELWAVNARWTPDGARRLTEKTQRYISPVVIYDKKTRQAVWLANVALCAMPATYGAQPLVAASRRQVAPPSAACNALIAMAVKRFAQTKKVR